MNNTEQPAVAGPIELTVRPQHTEWAEIRTALSRKYGHLYSVKGVPDVDYSKHAYVGRACTLLLKAEQQETAARNVIKAFEALGPNCRTENDDAR